MSRGPFANVKQVYTLTWPGFSVGAHLRLLSERESRVAGLDASEQNLEALCCTPKAGHPGILDGTTASITPSFMGLQGTLSVKGRPESRLLPVVRAIGLKFYGTFSESAESVEDGAGWEAWTLKRFIPNGGKTLTGGPDGTWESEVVRISLVTERGDELDEYALVNAEVLALAGTLQLGDLLTHPVHGLYQVRGVLTQGDFERGRLER